MKQKHEQFILNIIATIIGAFIAGYVLAYITFGVKRFILSVIIILVTFIVINSLYKITKNYFILYEKIIMIENTLEEGKRFLISYLRNKNIDYETIHPWRSSWEFIVLHSLRVEGYVKKIFDGDRLDLSQEEILTTRLSKGGLFL